MKQPRLPKATNKRITVESLETKEKAINISEKTGESLKEIVVRLIDNEHKKIGGK
jgi:hypothetical protein